MRYVGRPVSILGAGVLGRRIASVFLAGGYDVHIRDPSKSALAQATAFIDANISSFTARLPLLEKKRPMGTCKTFTDLAPAVSPAWLVIEAVPEKLDLKVSTLAEVDAHAPADCIIASNSSSFKMRLMDVKVREERKRKMLNMHFCMPPAIRTVELMTSGQTEEPIFGELSTVLKNCGMIPVTAKHESTGFVFNRLWAAVKREILTILAEDVSSPEQIDILWREMFQQPTSLPPCRLMDQVGLDTVALIEDNYIQERGLNGRLTVDWLRANYVELGRLGLKSDKGGLYPPPSSSSPSSSSFSAETANTADDKMLYVLDVGLGANNSDIDSIPTSGRILRFNPANRQMTPILEGQNLPDGIDVSKSTNRIFWTNMGRATSINDGSVHSANLDGSDVRTLLPSGTVRTPKQLVVDDKKQFVYFCDREGMGVHRVKFDGTGHEILVQTGSVSIREERKDMTRWCVGITLDTLHGYVYWTQKGPSKGGRGRIFRALIDIPAGQTAETRTDIELVLDRLPEPIDLEIDSEKQVLYWTDRGEHPTGCSLNRLDVETKEKTILARHFNEPIGLKLDGKGAVYVSDLGGSLYRVAGGEKTVVWKDEGCYTGLSMI